MEIAMTRHFRMTFSAMSGIALALAAYGAWAQQMYRQVGPDGRVTYSDQPPAAGTATTESSLRNTGNAAQPGAALPYELRQTASRYPVVLYTSSDCAPCASARSLLGQRGVPYTERTISSPEDSQALTRISGDGSLPFATVGSQHLKGYSEQEWVRYLDAAGYPKSSQLPPGYRQAPATPLVAPQAASAAATRAATPAATPATRPGSNSVAPRTSPSGIQF
jgi:glutaredoxin